MEEVAQKFLIIAAFIGIFVFWIWSISLTKQRGSDNPFRKLGAAPYKRQLIHALEDAESAEFVPQAIANNPKALAIIKQALEQNK